MKTTLFLAIIASLALSVTAYCPNLCSGHGTCQAGDTCACYKYSGTARGDFNNLYDTTREAWTGADCSLRTCPIAFSWSGATPSGFISSNNMAATGTSGTYSFTVEDSGGTLSDLYKDSVSVGSKVRIGADGGAGVAAAFAATQVVTVREVTYDGVSSTSTVYTYEASTLSATHVFLSAGEDDSEADSSNTLTPLDANTFHAPLECAGQGICDRTTGECDCFPGYEGEACTRSVCPSSCSGHGICLSLERLAADATELYNKAWDHDKHYGCKCDIGFRGPDCSLQECPSDYDPLHGCGGGVCNMGSTYTDASGIPQNCPNFGSSDCDVSGSDHEKQERDCSGRGICDYETGICKCFSGFYGEACGSQTILI